MHPGGSHNQQQQHYQQQLQPFGSGSNSAHSSPLKRAPQAVSPLASPMESRRIFMAHQQQSSMSGGSGSPQHGQQAPHSMGISPLQLGYALPAGRLLVDPHTGQQYYLPTAHPLPAPAAAAPAAYYTPPIFYNQPAIAATFYQHHHQQPPPHQSVVTTNTTNMPLPGSYLYPAAAPTPSSHQPVTSSTGYYAPPSAHYHPSSHAHHQPQPQVPISTATASFYSQHQSQSPMGHQEYHQQQQQQHHETSSGGYRVEIPPSTIDSGSNYGGDGAGEDRDSNEGGGGRGNAGAYGCYSSPSNRHPPLQHQQQQQQPQYFQRREQCRLSTESRGSSIRGTLTLQTAGGIFGSGQLETHSNPDESAYGGYQQQQQQPSSPPSPPHLSHQQQHRHFKPVPPPLLFNQQMTLSAAGGSSSESTSGFASGGRSRTRTFGDEPRSPPPPQSPQRRLLTTSFPPLREDEKQHGHQRSYEEERLPSPQPAPPPRRAIRMDIDLSRPMSPPEHASTTRPFAMSAVGIGKQPRVTGDNQSVSVRATVSRTTPPTAFTISFNDSSAEIGEVSISELSLQEAARQAPKGRRLMMARRSVPPRGQQRQLFQQSNNSGAGQDSGSECGDPKRWLFRKMMMGREEERPATTHERGRGDGESVDEDDALDDLASEAGTYVVESRQQPNAAMTNNQLSGSQTQRELQSASSSASSSTSTASRTPSGSQRTPSPSPGFTKPPIRPNLVSQIGNGKRSLMNDLRKLREHGTQQPSIAISAAQQKKAISSLVTAPTVLSQKLPPAIPAHRKTHYQQISINAAGPMSGQPVRPCKNVMNQTITTQRPQPFRPHSSRCRSEPRNDGGRFSMRPSSGNTRPLPPLQAGKGPTPMRQQSANTTLVKASATPVQKSPEMLNWLRRKEYDPRKSLAIDTDKQQQKSQQAKAQSFLAPLAYAESTASETTNEEAFIANRSISVNPSCTGTITKTSSPFANWRSVQQQPAINRSHDDLSRLGGGESLDEESLMGGAADSYTNSLQRTIDELTQKCQKSVALIKQSGLSSSVEQVLQRVVQNKGPGGDQSEQLEQLSTVFDAIQKFLEEQTTTSSSLIGNGNRTMSGTFTRRNSTTTSGNNGATGNTNNYNSIDELATKNAEKPQQKCLEPE